MTRRTIRGCLALYAAAALVGCNAHTAATETGSHATAPSWATVGPNVQVSVQNAALAHGEVLADADPVNPRHLIACSGVWLSRARAFPHNGIREVAYVTFDGGRSWKQTNLTHVGAFDLDPVCSIGFHGIAYFGGASAFDPRPGHDWLERSTDGGLRWSKPSIFPWGDRDFIAIDRTNSTYRGRLYDIALNAVEATKGRLSSANLGELRSTNSGKTFLPSVTVFHNPPTRSEDEPIEYFSAPIAILRNGHVLALAYNWPDSAKPKAMATFLSTDGGATFSKPRVVAMRAGSPLIGTDNFKEEGASVLPLIASDDSTGPFENRVYVAWQDFAKHEYGTATYPAPQAAIMVAYSDDEGKTWSNPVEADDAPPWPVRQYPVVFAPSIAVNGRGLVAVTWYDARGLADGSGGSLRMAVSNDGGDTFSPSFEVASSPSLLSPDADRVTLEIGTAPGETHFINDLRYHVFGQDTQGLAADAAGNFHPVWVDNRTGAAQLWTATVAIDERPVRYGDAMLRHVRDVSKSVGLEIIGGTYDRRSQQLTADAALVNNSKHAIAGPIRLRITSLTSQLGQATIQGADNGVSVAGAIITFTPIGTHLLPKAESRRRHLVFHIDASHQVTSDDVVGGSIDYISITYKAYARTR